MGILGLGLVAVLAGVAIAVSRQPDSFRITRSATVAAPADTAFAFVNDFHRWQAWSPWEKLDPALKRSYSGAEAGVGAVYEWWSESNKAGVGKMTVTESTPHQRIVIKLEFIKPMAATNTTEFTFEPAEGGTKVTWSMHGQNTFMGKAFSLVMDMDKVLGKSFEEGLENLGKAVQGGQLPDHSSAADSAR